MYVIPILLVLPAVGLGILYTSLRDDVSLAAISVMLMLILSLVFINANKIRTMARDSKVLSWYILLFIFRLALLFYQSTRGDLPMSGSDWPVFHATALQIMADADHFWELLSPVAAHLQHSDLYDRIVAVIYTLAGPRSAYMYLFSYIMSELALLMIFQTAKLLVNSKAAAWSALIFYFWPIEMVYSVAYLREMTIQCCFSISLYFFVKYLLTRNLLALILSFTFTYLCARMHSGMVAAFYAYISVFAFYNARKRKLSFTPFKIALVAILMLAALGSGMITSATGRFNQVDSAQDVIRARRAVVSNTDYISAPGSSAGILLQTPLRFFYFVVSPLPWQVKSSGTLIAFLLDGIARLCVIYLIVKSFRKRNDRHPFFNTLTQIFMIIWAANNLIFSWGTNNFGTAMRHRMKVFPIEIMLIYTLRQQPRQSRLTQHG